MKNIFFAHLTFTFLLTVAVLPAVAQPKLNCQDGNIVLLDCQLEEVKKQIVESALFKAARIEALERISPTEEDLLNGIKVSSPAKCSEPSIRNRQGRIFVRSVCSVEIISLARTAPSAIRRMVNIDVSASVEGVYETYVPVIDTVSIKEISK